MSDENDQAADPGLCVEALSRRVRVHLAGLTLAETRAALVLRGPSNEAVIYIPREDIDPAMMQPSADRTYCDGEGERTYFHLPDAGPRAQNAAWSYDNPLPALAALKGYVAFNPRCVDWIQIEST